MFSPFLAGADLGGGCRGWVILQMVYMTRHLKKLTGTPLWSPLDFHAAVCSCERGGGGGGSRYIVLLDKENPKATQE